VDLSLLLFLSLSLLSTLSLSHSREGKISFAFLPDDLQIVRLSASKNSPATGFRDTAYSCASCNSTFRDICIEVFFFGVSYLDTVTNCDWHERHCLFLCVV